MAREQESQDLNKAKREMFDELIKLHAKAAEKSLSSLLKTEIQISDAKIQVKTVRNVEYNILEPAILVRNSLTSESDESVAGNMIYIMRQRDMQVFLNQLMGIDELPEPDFEFDDTALSAVEEVMNQMVHDTVGIMAKCLEDDMTASNCRLFLSEGPDTFSEIVEEEPGASTFVIRYRIRIKDVLDSEFMECISATAIGSINQEITNYLEDGEEEEEETEEEEIEEEEAEVAEDFLDDDEELEEEDEYLDNEYLDGEYLDDDLDESDVKDYLDDDLDDLDYKGGYGKQEKPAAGKPARSQQPVKPAKAAKPEKAVKPGRNESPVREPARRQTSSKKSQAVSQRETASQRQPAAQAASPRQQVWQNETIRGNLGLIMDVPLKVSVEIGRTKRRLKEVLNFGNGMVVELDKQADAPVDIIVNGQLIARGEVVVIDDNFGVRISEIVNTRSIIGNGE